MFPQGLQHCPQMSNVLISILGVYQDIFCKHHHKLVQMASKSLFISSMRAAGALVRPRHHSEFIVIKPGPKCDLGMSLGKILS